MVLIKVLLNNNIPVRPSRIKILKNATTRGSTESQQMHAESVAIAASMSKNSPIQLDQLDGPKDGPKYHTGALKCILAHFLVGLNGVMSFETV